MSPSAIRRTVVVKVRVVVRRRAGLMGTGLRMDFKSGGIESEVVAKSFASEVQVVLCFGVRRSLYVPRNLVSPPLSRWRYVSRDSS